MSARSSSGPRPEDLTVVVPTRDRPALLEGCLDAIGGLDPPPGDVIVVDSASTDPESIAAAATPARLIRCEESGASRARNAGWAAATTGIVAFVDDDVRVSADWVGHILEPFASDDVVLVTGAVRAEIGRDRAVAVTDDVPDGRFDRDALGNVGASANVAVRREVLSAVGGFDVLLGAGGRFRSAEDLDLFDRVFAHGDGWYTSHAVGLHHQWRTTPELLRLDHDYGLGFGVRVSKLMRSDRRRAVAVIGFEGRRLVSDLMQDARARYKTGLIGRLLWAGSALVGLAVGSLTPVRAGHLSARRRAG